MDDFGTGYSSLSYLRKFPFDKVKIDQFFIRELSRGGGSRAIIRAIVDLCRALGIATTAEGVETEEQLAVLGAENCTEVQGFLLARPMPAGEVQALLARAPLLAAEAAGPRSAAASRIRLSGAVRPGGAPHALARSDGAGRDVWRNATCPPPRLPCPAVSISSGCSARRAWRWSARPRRRGSACSPTCARAASAARS